MMKNYPHALVELRSKLKISQEQLANILEVSFSSVNRWENGKHQPTKAIKKRIELLWEKHNIKVETK